MFLGIPVELWSNNHEALCDGKVSVNKNLDSIFVWLVRSVVMDGYGFIWFSRFQEQS
jgi:hypothetical protein